MCFTSGIHGLLRRTDANGRPDIIYLFEAYRTSVLMRREYCISFQTRPKSMQILRWNTAARTCSRLQNLFGHLSLLSAAWHIEKKAFQENLTECSIQISITLQKTKIICQTIFRIVAGSLPYKWENVAIKISGGCRAFCPVLYCFEPPCTHASITSDETVSLTLFH